MLLLEIVLPDLAVILGVIVLLIFSFNLYVNTRHFRKDTSANQIKILTLEGTVREKDLFIGKILSDLQVEANKLAEVQFTKFKENGISDA